MPAAKAKTMTGTEWVALLIAQAPALRRAGVLRVQLEGYQADLSPVQEEVTSASTDEAALEDAMHDRLDPLDDPMTFGRGNHVPGFSKLEE